MIDINEYQPRICPCKGFLNEWGYGKHMFENRSKKQRIIIYLIISGIVTMILALFHLYQGWILIYALIAAIIEFFCIFYILYLPLKVKG